MTMADVRLSRIASSEQPTSGLDGISGLAAARLVLTDEVGIIQAVKPGSCHGQRDGQGHGQAPSLASRTPPSKPTGPS